ncbi:chemotaxis protein CheB [Pseudomonas sp. ABC1]|uniref:chemotaxis protein CheB n=1 Tax=Pseudomonas sp. ABC1 TaxID=2748080 RepID=UPI0015C31C81|nr:chemotaxis protein CheB [Pseudomonas sp. ABC1]QLF93128.1 chemotaxis protein CheB [Pseudomonas sp. ABC1]
MSIRDSVQGRAIDAVVIGTSAGGLHALSEVLRGLPDDYRRPVLVVQHIPDGRPTQLAQIFQNKTRLKAKEADDKEALANGWLYFAAPGYHLLVERDFSLALSQEEPVCFSRPSIDVLFESAADAWGERLAGVLLTGASEDGARGLECIHRAGGLTIVQRPEEAEMDIMPRAALKRFEPDHILSLCDIHRLLCELE